MNVKYFVQDKPLLSKMVSITVLYLGDNRDNEVLKSHLSFKTKSEVTVKKYVIYKHFCEYKNVTLSINSNYIRNLLSFKNFIMKDDLLAESLLKSAGFPRLISARYGPAAEAFHVSAKTRAARAQPTAASSATMPLTRPPQQLELATWQRVSSGLWKMNSF